jgi:hypothetical protein
MSWILELMTDHTSHTPKAQNRLGILAIKFRFAIALPPFYGFMKKKKREKQGS